MMKTYRRKPVEVKAMQYVVTTTPSDDAKPIIDMVNANGGRAYFLYDFLPSLGRHAPRIILEHADVPGIFGAHPNDWIVLADGEWTVMTDSFLSQHQEVTPVPGETLGQAISARGDD